MFSFGRKESTLVTIPMQNDIVNNMKSTALIIPCPSIFWSSYARFCRWKPQAFWERMATRIRVMAGGRPAAFLWKYLQNGINDRENLVWTKKSNWRGLQPLAWFTWAIQIRQQRHL